MAVTNSSFGAAVDAWVKASQARMDAVFRESCQRLVVIAQTTVGHGGNMPVDTGFLRYSGFASIESPIAINPAAVGHKDQAYEFNIGQTVGLIASLKIGVTFYFCWTAAYAKHVEYGTSRMRARAFVRLAAQQWQGIVNSVVAEAKTRAGRS